MPSLPVRDGSLYYEVHGDHGPPVLFVCGMGAQLSAWCHQVADLRRDHRVLVYDHLGIGRSESAAPRPQVRDMAADAVALLEHVGWGSAHVAGVSMGGMVSQALALDWRQRVRSLTLMATHMGGFFRSIPPMRGRHAIVDVLLRRPERRLGAVARLIYTPRYVEECGEEALCTELAGRFGSGLPFRTMWAQVAAVCRYRGARKLRSLQGLPAMVIQAEHDRLVRPAHSQRIHRRIPGSRLVRVPAGHAVQAHAPSEVNAALRGFVAEVEATKMRSSQ